MKWRVVTDKYLGYEVQTKSWWFPIWHQGETNTHYTVEGALACAESRCHPVKRDKVKRKVVVEGDCK